jgi:hypothetical protein
LEKIKNIDENILVAIFSGYPRYKRQAYKINKNLVTYEVKQDGTNLKENARHIATEFVKRLQQLINEMQSNVEKEKLELEKNRQALEKAFGDSPPDVPDLDRNFKAYEKCKSDPEWLAKYESKYVAFVDGEQVFPEITDEQELLKLIREKYAKQWRLFTKVQKAGKTRVVKAPSGYSKIKKI